MAGYVYGYFQGGVPIGSNVNLFEPELVTYMDGLTTPLSSGQKTKLNTFIKALKTGLNINALSDAFDVLRIRANQTNESGLRNIVKRQHDATDILSPSFTPFEGIKGGSNSYVNENYNPAVDGINYSLNSAAIGGYAREMHSDGAKCLFGLVKIDGESIRFLNRRVSGKEYYNINSSLEAASVDKMLESEGSFCLSRLGANEVKVYLNGDEFFTMTTPSTLIPSGNLCSLGEFTIDNSSSQLRSEAELSLFYVCRGITVNEEKIISDAFRSYMYSVQDKYIIQDLAQGISANVVDVTDDQTIRSFNITTNQIRAFSSMSELKTNTYSILYDLPTINALFQGELRWFWQLNNNSILIWEKTVGEYIGGLWVLDQTLNTLTKVVTFRNKYMSIPFHWTIEIIDNVIYYAEYGNSPVESGLGTKADATKLWKSVDYGLTFTELYDFKNIPNVKQDGLHIHAVHYDAHWDRLWVTTGDVLNEGTTPIQSSKRLNWSDDGGLTWSSKDLYKYWGDESNALNNAQGLSMFSTPSHLFIGGDDYQNCIYRVTKTNKLSDPVLEVAYSYDDRYNDRITQYTARWQKLSTGVIVVALKSGDSAPRRTRLIGTRDGVVWKELFTALETSVSVTANDCGLSEVDGNLYMQFSDENPDTNLTRLNLVKLKI